MSTTSTPAVGRPRRTARSRRWRRSSCSPASRGPALGLLVLCVALSHRLAVLPHRRTTCSTSSTRSTCSGILALGMTAVIVIGGIDLSVGAVLALAMMVLGWLSHDAGLAAVARDRRRARASAGGRAASPTGWASPSPSCPPFIATLAMMSIARGLANVITDGQQIVGFPDWFTDLSTSRHFGFLTVTAVVLIVLYVARLGVHALPARRPRPVRHRRQRRGRPARRHPASRATTVRRLHRHRPARRPGRGRPRHAAGLLPAQRRHWATSSTRSPPW